MERLGREKGEREKEKGDSKERRRRREGRVE